MPSLSRLVRSMVYPERRLVGQQPLTRLVGNLNTAADDTPNYAVSQGVATLLAELVCANACRNILEFGAGSSSRVFARALARAGGGRLTSVEQSPEWCREAWEEVEAAPGVRAQLIVALPELRVCREGVYHVYARAAAPLAAHGPYDFVLVDAPQWYYGRDGALPLVYDMLAPGALIVVDDAGRPQERWAIYRWLQTYPGLELLAYDAGFGRNGVAVLRHTGDKARKFALASWMSSVAHVAVNALTRRLRGLRTVAPERFAGSTGAPPAIDCNE
jgi:predicted O-methyltransferase YrrM